MMVLVHFGLEASCLFPTPTARHLNKQSDCSQCSQPQILCSARGSEEEGGGLLNQGLKALREHFLVQNGAGLDFAGASHFGCHSAQCP